MKYKAYVGTYTTSLSKGIYSFDYQDKKISNVKLFANCQNPKYLTFVNDNIATVCEHTQNAGICIFNPYGKEIDRLTYENKASCFIAYNKTYLYTVNYHEGTFNVISTIPNLKLVAQVKIAPFAGCHQVIFYHHLFLIPCLCIDKIIVIDDSYKIIAEILLPKGSGPRHAVLSYDERYLYVVGELNNKLYVIDLKYMKIVNQLNLLANSDTQNKGAAAIRICNDYLYVSIRYQDVISIMKIKNKQVQRIKVLKSYGQHPRDFIVQDHHLFILNRMSNNLILYDLNNDHPQQKIFIPEGIALIMKEVL